MPLLKLLAKQPMPLLKRPPTLLTRLLLLQPTLLMPLSKLPTLLQLLLPSNRM